jgi:large subunit ribosomal protein L25
MWAPRIDRVNLKENQVAQLVLKTDTREVMGKGVQVLRRKNITPLVVYGHGVDSIALQAGTDEVEKLLRQAGETRLISLTVDKEKKARPVLVKGVQRDPLTRKLIHVDFHQVKMDEKVTTEVPIVLVGEATALLKGSSVLHQFETLTVESFPDKIPANLKLDISSLTLPGQVKKVKDIPVDADITVTNDPDQVVAIVVAARVEEKVVEKGEPVAEEAPAKVEPPKEEA